MIRHTKIFFYSRIFTDILALNVVILASGAITHTISALLSHSYSYSLIMVLNIMWIISAKNVSLYEDFRSRNYSFELIKITQLIIIQVISLIIFLFITKEDIISRNFASLYGSMLLIVVGCKSYILRKIISYYRQRGKNLRRILFVGISNLGLKFYHNININSHYGYKVVGFVDDEKDSRINGLYLGNIDSFEEKILAEEVDDVIITLPTQRIEKINDIVRICNKHAKRVKIIPEYLDFVAQKISVNIVDDILVYSVGHIPLDESHNKLGKRVFDILFSVFFILVVVSWLLPLIALLQLLFSPGPIFFVQERIGKDNKKFRCFKFRTMYINKTKNEFKATEKNDNRITRLGKILRKTNLDEIPQFINVLLGDMSIVGPRPHAIAFNEKYSEYVEDIKLRHLIKPGITGWAQINGLRGDVPDEEENKRRTKKRIEFDLWYIGNWTIWLDIQIVILTMWRMLKGDRNAY